jgi:hypothetical protein
MMQAAAGPMLAADGTPLKASLRRALRAQKMRALMLVGPLLVFVLVTFLFPIGDMLLRSVDCRGDCRLGPLCRSSSWGASIRGAV